MLNRPAARAVTRSSLERNVWGSNLGPIKSTQFYQRLAIAANFFSKRAVLLGSKNLRRWAPPQIPYTLRRNTASITKDLIIIMVVHLKKLLSYAWNKKGKRGHSLLSYLAINFDKQRYTDIRFHIFLVYNKIRCHFQNYS